MSLIRKNDEHWRDNLLGLTLNAKLEREIGLRHGQEVKDASKRFISESAFVSRLNPQNKILDIGFNCPNDLILNNFGTWLAGLIRAPVSTTSVSSVALIDSSNTSRTVNTYASSTNTFNFATTQTLGTKIKLGSGTTAAARTNYDVETAFGTAPESGSFSTNIGSYAAAAISFSGAISAGGAGTVNEMGFYGVWYHTGAAVVEFMLFHDILSIGVAFVAGDTLNASYSITL